VSGVTPVAAAEVARIVVVGIVGDCPSTVVVEVSAADSQVRYTPCGT
jgi:hypothetical protein